jgi:A/G-specific adenine glycosylase
MPHRSGAAPTATTSGTEPVAGPGSGFAELVLGWGTAHRRELPWRATRDPWQVLSSEVMLQQTQASRVVGPFVRWVERFPDPRALARAGPAAALRAWQGLGYNRRALRLYHSAVVITERFSGRVPADEGALRSLPGVGRYTARAVLAFAFEAPVGVVDTNVARVLSRVSGRRLGPSEAWALADRLVPAGQSWAYNQALFDLGVLHCRSGRPQCEGCPLGQVCGWAASGLRPPDPAARRRGQNRFAGSDRQGRGQMVAALVAGPLAADQLAAAAGWPGAEQRARRVAETLVRDGLATWTPGGGLRLP